MSMIWRTQQRLECRYQKVTFGGSLRLLLRRNVSRQHVVVSLEYFSFVLHSLVCCS